MAFKRSTRAVTGLALGLIIAVVVGILGNVAADAAPTQAESGGSYLGRVGMNSNGFWFGANDAGAAYSRLAAGGVTRVREDFNWNAIEPQRGQFNWSRPDTMMTAASRAGVEVLGILDYSAAWASSDPSGNRDEHFAPRDNADYAAYARAVVRRYGPNGTFWSQHPELTAQPVTAMEIWNEPWGWWSWRDEPNPAAYAAMARAAAEAIHAADPSVKVVMEASLLQARHDGATAGWIDQVLGAQPALKSLVDVFSLHPYPYPKQNGPNVDRNDPRWDYRQIELVRQTTISLGARKPIWVSEIGWSTAPEADGAVTEAQQSRYIQDAVVRAFTNWPYVERIYLYSDDRDGSNRRDLEAWFGLFHGDGSAKPAWSALTQMIRDSGTATPPTTTPPTTTPPTTSTTRPPTTTAPPTTSTTRPPTTTAPPTTSTTRPPTTTPPTTTPPTTTPPRSGAVLMPARLVVRVLGRVLYYDPAV